MTTSLTFTRGTSNTVLFMANATTFETFEKEEETITITITHYQL